ncbi:MAG: alpha/beta fold hydrolase, partial [Chloroflexi bacterium]|nr:alpha/beta fold hydrolase [Chloroflexota bacterium]
RPDTQTLRAFLKQRVPDYMIPTAFMWLDSVPLTPNGKVSYGALPQPPVTHSENGTQPTSFVDGVERKLAAIWAELLELPTVGRDDNFFECGGHSLLAIRLFARIEATFGLKLPLTTLFKSPTIAELAAVLQVDEGETAVYDTLIPIQTGSNGKPPIFLVHGFGGGVVGYGELARLLGEDQAVFGLQAQGMDGAAAPHESIEAMAAHYVNSIREQQPYGPYLLGGYCYGGVVAYEVARQLRVAGDEIAMLGVFEGYAPLRPGEEGNWWGSPAHLLNFLRNIPYWFSEYRQLGSTQMLARVRRKARNQMKSFGKRMGTETAVEIRDILDDESEVPAAHRHVMEAQIRARKQYQPPAYDGPVALFRTKARSLFRAHDPQMGWQKLGKEGVDLRMIEGGHNNILERPYVTSLAQALRDVLDEGENN